MSNFDFDNNNYGRQKRGGGAVVMISIAIVMLLVGTLVGVVIYQGVDKDSDTHLEATTTPEATQAPAATPEASPEQPAATPAEAPEGVKEAVDAQTVYLGSLAAFSEQVADVVADAQKSVVGIHNYQQVAMSNMGQGNGSYYFYGWPFDYYYDDQQPQQEPEYVEQLAGSGSGVIYSANGYIITNYHVVQNADRVTVLHEGEEIDASVIGYDEVQDIALLKVERDNLPAARMGDSAAVRTGEFSIAIGSPLGDELAGTVTFGMISYANRTLELDGALVSMIQTDAAINSGNSGGALMNVNGEVIGINSRKQSGFTGNGATIEGIGFAIPINEVRATVDELIETGKITRPGLGIEGQEISGYQGYVPAGIQVGAVTEGGPAHKAGIQPGDIIVGADGKETTTFATLRAVLYSHKVGDTITVNVFRNGQVMEVEVQLGQLQS